MKNANGEGSICKWIRDGRHVGYRGAISYQDENGKRKRHAVYGKTRMEVKGKLDAARARIEEGAPVKDSALTIGQWMKRWRETTLPASDRKPATRAVYSRLSRVHLEAGPFAEIPLSRLRASDVDALTVAKRGELADASLRLVFVVLKLALDGAVRDGLLARNPSVPAARPRVERKEARFLTVEETQAVLSEAVESPHYPVIALLAATGLRRGEALALTWSNLDLYEGLLHVRSTVGHVDGVLEFSTPKTKRSRRTIPLHAPVVALLRARKKAQAAQRLAAGSQWEGNGLVFTTALGKPVDPRIVLRVLQEAAEKAGVEQVSLHTLRHSAAVVWLEAGVHIRAVADLLGHSSVAVTGDVYAHTTDQTARTAVEALTNALNL